MEVEGAGVSRRASTTVIESNQASQDNEKSLALAAS
jgi:hypothetical protein